MRMRAAAAVIACSAVLITGCTSAAQQDQSAADASTAAESISPSASAEAAAGEASTAPTPEATPSPTSTSYRDVVVDGRITSAAICRDYETKIKKYQAAAQGRIDNAQGKYKDAWAAADYRRTHDWLRDPLAKRYRESMTVSATRALNSVSDGQAGTVEDLDDYLIDSLEACGLTNANARAENVVQKSLDLGARIKARAANKPWYPKGYREFEDGLAYRWVDNAGVDCFSQCWYWTIDVVSQTGCPSGLYGELSIERGGAAVSWTNDSLSYLRPKQRGRLQFITYDDRSYGASGRLAELSCY